MNRAAELAREASRWPLISPDVAVRYERLVRAVERRETKTKSKRETS